VLVDSLVDGIEPIYYLLTLNWTVVLLQLEGVDLARLPEKLRVALEKVVRKLGRRETVSGVGLFGSWSRGDAAVSSDVDLLVLDRRDFQYEHVDRLECNDFLVDLNYISKQCVTGSVPSDVDQKLYETIVLYDRDWLLTTLKDRISRTYQKPERVGIRTDAYLVESDIYLSRATSAYNRGDFQSASVFAGIGLESMLNILLEASLLPISNTRFVAALERSATKLAYPQFLSAYFTVARLNMLNRRDAQEKLDLFTAAWDDISFFMKDNASALGSLHCKARSKLQYYGKPEFLRGMNARSHEIVHAGMYAEASHFVLHVLADLLENYAWLASTVEGVKLNYTTLFRSLKSFKETPTQLYETAVEAFHVKDITKRETENILKLAKDTALNVRRQRKSLIRRFIGPLA